MKELLMQYASYNIWANKQMIDAISQLPVSQVDQEIISSFPSLRKTVYHTWAAEYVWLQRLQMVSVPVWVAADFAGSFSDACMEWERVSAALAAYIARQTDNSLKEKIHYHDLRNNPHTTSVFDMLLHVFNHATYHRGQLVTMLRQLSVKEIPGTDFIAFVRWGNR